MQSTLQHIEAAHSAAKACGLSLDQVLVLVTVAIVSRQRPATFNTIQCYQRKRCRVYTFQNLLDIIHHLRDLDLITFTVANTKHLYSLTDTGADLLEQFHRHLEHTNPSK